MRFKCLIFDHDDTVVASTKEIHYPAFLEALRIMRPEEAADPLSCDEYFRVNFDPGFVEFCRDRYAMTGEEFKKEEEIWKNYVSTRIPTAYPGMKELMERQKKEGGIVAVVSHSFDFNIKRDFKANGLPDPDMVFGWELPPDKRKPSDYALKVIAEKYDLKPSDFVVIDDLKPGYDMARNFGAFFIGAGWRNDVPEIRDFMKKNSDKYITSVEELAEFLK